MPARLIYLDVARGLGSLLVVLGHNEIVLQSRGLAYAMIFSFHMPFFFFLSGMFLKTEQPLPDLLRARSDALLKPFFVTCLLLGIDDVLLDQRSSVGTYAGNVLYATGFTVPWMPMWFLPHLWLVSLLAWFLCRWGRFEEWSPLAKAAFLCAILATGAATIDAFMDRPVRIAGAEWVGSGLPFSIDLVLITGSFFMAGYLARRRLATAAPSSPVLAIAALAVFVFIALQPPQATMDLNLRRYDHIVLSTLAAASGIYLTLVAAQVLSRVPIVAKCLAYLGTISLFGLIFHKVFQDKASAIGSRVLPSQPQLTAALAFVIAVCGCVVTAEVIKRVRVLSVLYLPVSRR